MKTNRREFVAQSSVAVAALAGLPAWAATHFKGPYGVQMYSIRKEMQSNPAPALHMVRSIGYTEMEAWQPKGVDAKTLKPLLDAAGLKATGIHSDYEALTTKLNDVADNAKGLGAEWVVCAWVNEDKRKTPEAWHNLANGFNQIGKQLSDAGLKLGYHNHTVEFVDVNGKPALDLLFDETDPKLMWFEVDIGHVQRAGVEPAGYIRQHGSRVKLLHLKDVKPKAGVSNPKENDYDEVPIGQGMINMKEVLRTAADIGVERYYVEEEAGNVEQRLRSDYRFLKNITF